MTFDHNQEAKKIVASYYFGALPLVRASSSLQSLSSSANLEEKLRKIADWMDELVGVIELEGESARFKYEPELREFVRHYLSV